MLSLNAGYVDTAGSLALQGLFTAHVTGNFVTLGASLALGTSGAVAKLLALPLLRTALARMNRSEFEKLVGDLVGPLGTRAVLRKVAANAGAS